ncbi:hypothetical protein [Neisseria bacilliformis]|uniref:hypothetical protein n=1 Tax=Neisseria bacilliformis TaxID=267212 RepID=UPI0028EC0851|nr:hypothetical protein [Neisseria bacilliformis]
MSFLEALQVAAVLLSRREPAADDAAEAARLFDLAEAVLAEYEKRRNVRIHVYDLNISA